MCVPQYLYNLKHKDCCSDETTESRCFARFTLTLLLLLYTVVMMLRICFSSVHHTSTHPLHLRPVLLLLLLLCSATPPTQAGSCANSCANIGVCYKSSTNCYLSSANRHNTKVKCLTKGSSWCGDDEGKIECSIAAEDENINHCGGCVDGLCTTLGLTSLGSDIHGTLTTEGNYGKFCRDVTPLGCNFECNSGNHACQSASFWCGTTDSGHCSLTCDGVNACHSAELYCGPDKDCYVNCRGDSACNSLSVNCPNPPYKCEIHCTAPDSGNSNCASMSEAGNCPNQFWKQTFSADDDGQYSTSYCDQPERVGKTCTDLKYMGRQMYLDEATGSCVNDCKDGIFHVPEPAPSVYSRSCGAYQSPLQMNNCVQRACLERDSFDHDCCSTKSTAGCQDGYELVSHNQPDSGRCFAAFGLGLFTTCCTKISIPGTSSPSPSSSTSEDGSGGSGLLYTLVASGFSRQTPLLEGGHPQDFTVGVGGGSSLAPGSYTLMCQAIDSSAHSKLYVAESSRNDLFFTTSFTATLNTAAAVSSKTWRIDVRSPLDTYNADPPLRNATLTCTLHKQNVVVGSVTAILFIRNVIRPSVGYAHLSFSKDIQDSDMESSAKFTSWNQVLSDGRMEIRTSPGSLLRLRPHPDFDTGPSFINTKIYLTDDDGIGQPHTDVELTSVVVSKDGRNIFTRLPSLENLPSCASSGSSKSCNVCHLGLKLENVQVEVGGIAGSTFRCPPHNNASLTCYAGKMEPTVTSSYDSLRPRVHRWTLSYVPQCTGNYNLSGSIHCSKSVESAQTCAFGLCEECRSCPRGAICTGGYESQSFPGFYMLDFSTANVVPCSFPALARCEGFNLTTKNTTCGQNYTGHLCSRCNIGYYSTPDTTCLRCPAQEKTYDKLFSNMVPFLGALAMSSLIMGGLIWYLERKAGKRMKPACACCPYLPGIAIRQTKEFMIWVVLSFQVLASVSSSPLPGLPEWILRVYGLVSFFNLDSSYSLSPECIDDGSAPFNIPVVVLGGILLLTMIQSSIFAIGIIYRYLMLADMGHNQKKDDGVDSEGGKLPLVFLVLGQIQGKLFVVLSFGFPLVTKHVFQMLHCEKNNSGVLVLQWKGPYQECFVGQHASVAVLAYLVVLFYMFMFPMCTALYLSLRIVPALARTGDAPLDFTVEQHDLTTIEAETEAEDHASMSDSFKKRRELSIKSRARLSRWDHFISDDYSPAKFYFRHIYYVVTILMFAVYEHVDRSEYGGLRCTFIVLVFCIYLSLLFKCQPFNDLDRWKLAVRVCLVLCSVLVAILDVVRWSENVALLEDGKAMDTGFEEGDDHTGVYVNGNKSVPSPSIVMFAVVDEVPVPVRASLIIAYLLFASCMLLLLVLPLSFFVANYGACGWFCWYCSTSDNSTGTSGRHARRVTQDHISLKDEINPMDIEMTNVNDDYEDEDEDEGEDEYEADDTSRTWTRHFDESTGFWYLFNAHTNETRWEDYEFETTDKINMEEVKPALVRVDSFRSDIGEEKITVRISDQFAEKRETLLVKAREISTCDSTRMADGWIEVVDTDGRTCYVQLNTGQIRYDKPPQWVKSMMKLFNK